MKTRFIILLVLVLMTWIKSAAQQGIKEYEVLFEKAKYSMETKADLNEAIRLFESLIKNYPNEKEYVARALLYQGMCYEKEGNQEAISKYHQVVTRYPEQADEVAIAKERLARLNQDVQPKFTRIQIPSELSISARTSPDGKELLWVYDDRLWVMPLVGSMGDDIPGKPAPISTGEVKVLAAGLSWSQDGKSIAFSEFNEDSSLQDLPQEEKPYQKIYVISRDGDGLKKIVENYCDLRMVGWSIGLSPDGKLLAYSSVSGGDLYVHIVPVEGGIPRRLSEIPAREPVFSPDGKMIAFVKDKDSGRGGGGLYTVPVSGGEPTLVAEAENASSPVWSPDAGRIAFFDYGEPDKIQVIGVDNNGNPRGEKFSYDSPVGKTDITLLAGWPDKNKIDMLLYKEQYHGLYTLPDGGGPAQLVYRGAAAQPRWSSDGKQILFVKGDFYDWSKQSITLIPADGGEEKSILSFKEDQIGTLGFGTGLRVSPDGQKIVISAKKADEDTIKVGQTPVTQIWMVSINGKGLTRITDPPYPYTDGSPCWSPDGKSIAFVREELKEDQLNPIGQCGIYMIGLSGGDPVPLATEPDEFKYPVNWSPDGKSIAYIGYDHKDLGNTFLKVISLENGESREVCPVPTATGAHTELAWSPDSKRIAVNDREGKAILIISVDDGSVQNVETSLPEVKIFHLDWSPDGKRFVFAGATVSKPEFWFMEDFLPLKE